MAKPKTDQERFPEKYFITPEGHPRDRVIINENSRIPKEGQFISLNGYGFLAKPNAEIDLPRPVLEMLDTRIETETIQDEDGKSFTRDIKRITYTLVKRDVNRTEEPIKIPDEEVWDVPEQTVEEKPK